MKTAGDGGLLAYGPSTTAMHQQLAALVARSLGGAKAGALPIEQPTKFELVINLKTAKAIGATIPQPLLERIPVVVGMHLPQEFREKVYEEKREQGGGEYVIGLGKAQTAGFTRILNAMFERVVEVSSPAAAAATDAAIRGVLEPALD